MLKLVKVCKEYKVADTVVEALRGLTISFRKNEFVSILGPSGCGKTTTLNIVGGLDKYSSGDLFIAGKSTKEFTSRDWDIYRNQRIGFIFQSYNLIPHQTVLGNVELALTISGVSKEERIQKAKKALDKVGLANQYYKKPNQLSGGQCQRVAIARALVNDPEILLADEPTGALDTKTSIQIMELIKEIAKEKLVIMVTHNPELAEKYSTRIVRLLDGEMVEDSNPFSEEEENNEIKLLMPAEINKKGKAKMSWWTAFKLSARNLLSKRSRTIMTCFAGSIGIIGVSTVLAVSNGVKGYIADMQDDMLSGNPITVQENGLDLSSIMGSMSQTEKVEFIKELGFANVNSVVEYLANRYTSMDSAMYTNNITEEYIKYLNEMPSEIVAAIGYDYGLDMTNNLYTDFSKDKNAAGQNVSLSTIRAIYSSLLQRTSFAEYSSLITSIGEMIKQAPSNNDYIASQYDILSGKIATNKNEIMIVLDKDRAISDLVLANLGYFSQDEFLNIAYRATNDEKYESAFDKNKFTYEELLNKEFTWYPNNQVFNKTRNNPLIPFTYNGYSSGLDEGLELKVVGILEPKENVAYGCLTSGVYYTEELSKYAIADGIQSEMVAYLQTTKGNMISSFEQNGVKFGVTFDFTYEFEGSVYNETSFVGNVNAMKSLMASMGGGSSSSDAGVEGDIYQLGLRAVGGCELANSISIYPIDFKLKEQVLDYLDRWNSEDDITLSTGEIIKAADREKIQYSDTLSIIIEMINSMIDLITTALIAFTSLSLVVSCVMIAIITYISVVERVKEIGVIRSLGGRKSDVSNLFNAETLMIGASSGVLGIVITYLLSFILNLIVKSLAGISTIASLSPLNALVMVLLSILLTIISGLIPASKAARQDPVAALRTE